MHEQNVYDFIVKLWNKQNFVATCQCVYFELLINSNNKIIEVNL